MSRKTFSRGLHSSNPIQAKQLQLVGEFCDSWVDVVVVVDVEVLGCINVFSVSWVKTSVVSSVSDNLQLVRTPKFETIIMLPFNF